MNLAKVVGIVLIVAGAIGLVMGSFTYTKDTEAVKLGPVELTYSDENTYPGEPERLQPHRRSKRRQ